MTNMYLEVMREKYPNFMDCTIQLFDDWKKWRNFARKIDQHKFSKEDLERGLEAYNKKWAGIFFSVNSMVPWERDQKSVTHINARVCEIDDLSKEEQLKLISVSPLAPSLVIESNKSFHMYRFAKDWTIENRNKICWGLRNFFNWDPAVVDISRVLRAPWYYHMKDEEHPFECIIADWCWEYYTEEQMFNAFPDTESISEKKQKAIKKEQQLRQAIWNDGARDRIRAMDCKAMLERISWTNLVRWETISFKHNSDGTEQIWCNWKSTGCWLDKQWKIWSKDWWWPNWTNRIDWYGWVDWKEIYKRIKEEFPFVLPEKKAEEKSLDDILSAVDTDINTELHTYYYPKGFEKFNSFLSWELVTIVAPSNSWKTTFAMDIIKRNTAEWRKCFYINWEFRIETVWVNRWLWAHWKTKEALWDKNPLTAEERADMEQYVKDCLGQFGYDCSPMGYKLEDLVELITEKAKEGYELFVIDSLSKIQWNLTNEARSHQNQTMETFLALVQKLNIAVILLHHTNKFGKFEGSQKIFDFSNVFITMAKNEDDFLSIPSRTFRLEKDKYVNDVELEMYYDIKTWTYTESLSEAVEAKKNNFNS